ncbi:MAG: Uma2 family endonuclease [Alicyclobacillaceae bacterium]|nr:Uma2 family endonuclease [Alicyclobacillaceae bacterium]
MNSPRIGPDLRYSYRDYLTWDDGQRWELIEGVPYNMTQAPSPRHQEILGNIFGLFFNYLDRKDCKAYLAPFDVRLSESDREQDILNVVQPDLSIVCDPGKIDHRGCKGAPDLVVEILSPETAKRDKGQKFYLYQAYGVREYWIVDSHHEIIEVYVWKDGRFQDRQVYEKGDRLPVGIFEDFALDVAAVFRR